MSGKKYYFEMGDIYDGVMFLNVPMAVTRLNQQHEEIERLKSIIDELKRENSNPDRESIFKVIKQRKKLKDALKTIESDSTKPCDCLEYAASVLKEMEFNMKILVYGTLKQGFHNHHILSKSRLTLKGIFEVPGHRLIESGLPYLIASSNTSPFYGEIYEIDSEETLKALDQLEGHPTFYKRTYIPNLECSVYVLQDRAGHEEQLESISNYGA